MTKDLKAVCAAIEAATEADHVGACAAAGRRAPLLGKFMFELCDWIATSEKSLTEAYGREWMSYSREQWITDKEVWGKKFKPSMATFDRLLKAGKDIGVLETGQWPTVYTGWEAALICAPTANHIQAVADQLRTKCEAVADQLRNPDLQTLNKNRNPNGALVIASERPDPENSVHGEERSLRSLPTSPGSAAPSTHAACK